LRALEDATLVAHREPIHGLTLAAWQMRPSFQPYEIKMAMVADDRTRLALWKHDRAGSSGIHPLLHGVASAKLPCSGLGFRIFHIKE
jgi:hypothetical protein